MLAFPCGNKGKIFPQCIHVQDSSQPGEARRLAIFLCHSLGFSELSTAQVALVVTELATNLVKHTEQSGGYLIFSPFEQNSIVGLDILSLDQSVGITNISECLRDGYSSTNTTGGGLGSIRRQSTVFDIFSVPDKGVAILSRFWPLAAPEPFAALDVGAVCLPITGEEACGDAWAMKAGPDSTLFMLADGLGHGPDAAEAANQAVATFLESAPRRPAELLMLIHNALRHTRGAAIAIAEIYTDQLSVHFAGIGNITAQVHSDEKVRNLFSHNGTAGIAGTPKIMEFIYPWTNTSLLIMHSDGLATHWSFDDYPGLANKHPALIAGVLFRDHQRLHDDSCVLVAKPR